MSQTPLEVIANVTRVVTKVTDRICGDRSDYPLLVALATQAALKNFKITAQVIYGPCAWIEILNDYTPMWAGCWGDQYSFWVTTQFGEVVDLNVSVAHRKVARDQASQSSYSPPLLWSREVPAFYRYQPIGIAEVEALEERDQRWLDRVLEEVNEKCRPEKIDGTPTEFPDEPILCPGRQLLDDSRQSFKHFDRSLGVHGVPAAPF